MNIKVTMTILSCVISIIIIVFAYYGVIRYMHICNRSCEYFASKYMDLSKVNSNSKVVVSFYLKEDNLSSNKTLKSILDQTVHPDQILILVDSQNISVPDFLKKDSIIVTQLAGGDMSASAFLAPLRTQKDATTKIVVLSDGVVYGPDFLETIVEESEKSPETIIFIEGYNAHDYLNGKLTQNSPVNFINLQYGALIKPSMFDSVTSSESKIDAPSAILSKNILQNKVGTRKIHYGEIFNAQKGPLENEKRTVQIYAQYFI